MHKTTRPHYKEISDSFDELLDKKFIEVKKENKERIYTLTLCGLTAGLHETSSLENSWKQSLGYCYHKGGPSYIRHFIDIYRDNKTKILEVSLSWILFAYS